MAYIDQSYYTQYFGGTVIPASDFTRLADIASDLIFSLCDTKPDSCMARNRQFKKACCYQVEFLFQQGGTEAIFGRSDASQSGGSEHLGNYSVSGGGSGKDSAGGVKMVNGVPVSSFTVSILEHLGLLSRWMYAGRYMRGRHGKH